jgi:hypothetical protein
VHDASARGDRNFSVNHNALAVYTAIVPFHVAESCSMPPVRIVAARDYRADPVGRVCSRRNERDREGTGVLAPLLFPQMGFPVPPAAAMGVFPMILLPTFAVPLSIFMHVFALGDCSVGHGSARD